MFDTLAEITSKWDISGVWCLASILWIFIISILYSKNSYFGSCTCAFIFFCAVCWSGELGFGGEWIANKNQTKWKKRNHCMTTEKFDCYYVQMNGWDNDPGNDYWLFIPEDEMYRNYENKLVMKSNGEDPWDDLDEHFYNYNNPIMTINAPSEAGGLGIPQWLYHPASAVYLFGLAGLPAMVVGGFVVNKMKG